MFSIDLRVGSCDTRDNRTAWQGGGREGRGKETEKRVVNEARERYTDGQGGKRKHVAVSVSSFVSI